jgi:hypothetical protein
MVTDDLLALLAITLLILMAHRAVSVVREYRGIRLISCPGTGQAAAVELALPTAALSGIFRSPLLRVRKCSGWPERRDCGQACTQQIGQAPADSLIANILTRWCADQACVCCGAPLRSIPVGPHQPCFMSADRKVFEWREVPPQELPRMLESCGPVCWTCLMAETHTW